MPARQRAASDSAVKIGAKVRAQRVRKNKSRDKLGREIGKTGQQVARYESGENEISSVMLERIADALDCDTADFHNSKNKPPEGE